MKKYLITSATTLLLPFLALAHSGEDVSDHHAEMMADFGSSFFWSGWVTMILFWIVLILIIAFLIKSLTKK